jgi:hypothetical protein
MVYVVLLVFGLKNDPHTCKLWDFEILNLLLVCLLDI